jgi:hypothetical protein
MLNCRAFGVIPNVDKYIEAHGLLLKLEWTTIVAGHLSRPGTREDVQTNLQFTQDTAQFIRDGIQAKPAQATIASIPPEFLTNSFLVASEIQGAAIEFCYEKMLEVWGKRLASVDVFGRSHCTRMHSYVTVELGE